MAELAYAYLAPSEFAQRRPGRPEPGHQRRRGPSGAVAHPFFFPVSWRSRPVAQALLMLARVARTRFYVPPNTLAAVLRAPIRS